MKLTQNLITNWLRLSMIVLLIIGIVFRFSNIDKKAYWFDEAATSLVISGYTQSEVYQEVYDGKVRDIKELYKYQDLNPEKSLADTIKVLAVEDSQHPPLYYVMARLWSKIFGTSPKAIRSLSAFISLLTFPCLYWLCFELFGSVSTGLIVIALTSVSLFHLMYAQEAREYTLWIVMTLISSATLLRAIRLDTKFNWGLYVLTISLSLYTYPFTIFVMIGHGLYLSMINIFRPTKMVVTYLLASLICLLIFSPWLFIIINNFQRVKTTTNFLYAPTPFWSLPSKWALNLSYIFVSAKPRIYFPLLILIAYSLYFLCSKTSQRVWLFILTLMTSMAIPLVAADLMIGGRISISNRYLSPLYLAVQVTVAYLFSHQLFLNNNSQTNQIKIRITQFLWLIILTVLITLGCWTCTRFLQTDKGWNKGDFNNIPISQIINKSPSPLIISNAPPLSFLALTHLLKPEVKVQLVDHLDELTLDQNTRNIFLFQPTVELSNLVQQKYHCKTEAIHKKSLLKVVN